MLPYIQCQPDSLLTDIFVVLLWTYEILSLLSSSSLFQPMNSHLHHLLTFTLIVGYHITLLHKPCSCGTLVFCKLDLYVPPLKLSNYSLFPILRRNKVKVIDRIFSFLYFSHNFLYERHLCDQVSIIPVWQLCHYCWQTYFCKQLFITFHCSSVITLSGS